MKGIATYLKIIKYKILCYVIFFLSILAIMNVCESLLVDQMQNNNLKIKVAYCLLDESQDMESISKLLVNSNEITDKFDLTYVNSEEEAIDLVLNKTCVAAIVIPVDFLESVLNGKNHSPIIYMSQSFGMEKKLLDLLVDVLEDYMRYTQSGVYTIINISRSYGIVGNQTVFDANYAYVTSLLNRKSLFSVNEIKYVEEVTLYNYYQITLLIYLVFLSLLLFYEELNFEKDIRFIQQINTISNLGIKILWTKLSAMLILVASTFVLALNMLQVELNVTTIASSILVSMFMVLIQSILLNISEYKMINLIINILVHTGSLFLVGGIIPTILLSEILKNLSLLTPMYYVQNILLIFFKYNDTLTAIVYVPIVCSLILSCIISYKFNKKLEVTNYEKN